MSETTMPIQGEAAESGSRGGTLAKLARFSFTRLVILMLTVTVGVYLTVLIANMGGYVDEIRKGAIREQVSVQIFQDKSAEIRALSSQEKQALIDERVAILEKQLGLDQPFIVRSFVFLKDALTLNLGMADMMISDSGSKTVKLIILERLPSTLVLWGLSNLILFFVALFGAMFLSRRYGSFLDKAIIALAPTGSAPVWFYGLFLIMIFAAAMGLLPRRDGGCTAAGQPDWLWLEPGQAPGPAGNRPTDQRGFPECIQLADLLPDLLQRGLCRDGEGQGAVRPGYRAPLCAAPDPADHYHLLCAAADRAVAGRYHPGDHLQLARAGTSPVSSHRSV
jgi:hypothetical protein